jgi:alkylation response protein AidB-like acyl-CoA dehydrogenase
MTTTHRNEEATEETDRVALAQFERDAQMFLDEAASRWSSLGRVERRIALFPDLTPEEESAEVAAAREWRSRRFDAGFGWICGPREYGGRGLARSFERAYVTLERRHTFPNQRIYDIGIGMVAPTLMAFGSEMVKRRYLRAIHRGDLIGCQLFSEPGAGSDLSSIQSRAFFGDEEWRINGQKVWSSGAHLSDVGLLICRTGEVANRHKNLTAFALPMASAGVTVRPIRQMTGGASFNEVFLDDVRIPDSHRLGDVDGGWKVILATLMNERAAVGSPSAGGTGILSTQRLADLLHRFGDPTSPLARDELMQLHCALAVARMTRLRTEAKQRAGQPPGPDMSIGKISLTNNLLALVQFVSHVLGPLLVADSGETDAYAWGEFVLGVPGLRLGGGTDEIQKNILAERVLGLPR